MKQIIPFVKDVNLNTKISEVTSIALEHNLQMENSDSIVGSFIVSGKYKINEISINEEVFEKEIPFDITLDDKYDATKVQIDIDDFYYEIINEEVLRIHIDVLANNLVYCKEQRQEIKEDTPALEQVPAVEDMPVLEEIPEVEEIPVLENVETKEESLEVTALENDVNKNLSDEEIKEPEQVLEEVISSSKETQNIERNEQMVITEEKNEEVIQTVKEDTTNEPARIDISKDLSSSLLSGKEEYVTYKVHIIRDDETIEMVKEKYSVSTEELEKYNSLDNVVIGTKIIVPIKND